jgi:uncharacterized protein (DUF2147 family)
MTVLALAVAAVAGFGGLAEAPGLWRTPAEGGGLVRLAPCGRNLCGTIVGSARLETHPDQRDARNADPGKRSRPLKGLRILEIIPSANGEDGEGWVYNPEDGRTYRGAIRLTPDGRLHLKGCVARPLCRTQVWVRGGGGIP